MKEGQAFEKSQTPCLRALSLFQQLALQAHPADTAPRIIILSERNFPESTSTPPTLESWMEKSSSKDPSECQARNPESHSNAPTTFSAELATFSKRVCLSV